MTVALPTTQELADEARRLEQDITDVSSALDVLRERKRNSLIPDEKRRQLRMEIEDGEDKLEALISARIELQRSKLAAKVREMEASTPKADDFASDLEECRELEIRLRDLRQRIRSNASHRDRHGNILRIARRQLARFDQEGAPELRERLLQLSIAT
jgi:hypothetical protein